MIDYLKYSGATISVALNPYHWAWKPIARIENELDWDTDAFRVSILFLTVRIWIDNGEW